MTSQLNKTFDVNKVTVGGSNEPYFIAEAGSNFDQDLNTGLHLIDIAADAGANAVKFQLFRADALYPDGGKIHAAFKAVELNPDWVPKLAEHAASQHLTFLASAFDPESIKVLESIGVPAHKIASSETTNLKLLDQFAETGKPLFLSTGMCDLIDVQDAVARCLARGNNQIALLQCGAMYPLPPEHAHLRAMDLFRNVFATPVFQNPLELGADIVVYSTTKHIDGQGRTVGGAILTNDELYYNDYLRMFVRHTGPTMSPFSAWVLAKSLETLDVRVQQQSENAAKISNFLEEQQVVEKAGGVIDSLKEKVTN